MNPARLTLPILFIASAALLAVLAFVTDGVEGRTITVDDSGGADYEKIQDAIDASDDGDTVRVWDGVYEENVVVRKSVDLVGNGSEVTTIDGGANSVVKITADWVNISGFTVRESAVYGDGEDAGIRVESDNNHIFMNNCSNNGFGIILWKSDDCKITNNTCSKNSFCGIELWDSSNCKITNNTFSNNYAGIFLVESSNCKIENNTMNENGISIYGSLENWTSHTIETTNMVNGKPVYYYKNVTGFTVPSGAGLVILANCSWTNLENQNYSNGPVGILVGYSSNITITNSTCSENHGYGISLQNSSNCKITNNTCTNNRYGILLLESRECKIENNTCSANNDHGISLYSSSNCKIENNTISENGVGIYQDYSSRDNTAHYNNIYNNTEYGIEVENNRSYSINATYNWWGAASGPYHPTKNSKGKGDTVTDYVIFSPWLDENGNLRTQGDDDTEDTNDDFTILGMDGNIILGLLGVALLLALLSLLVFMGRSPREKGKPPEGKEKSGGVDEGSKK